MNAQFVCSFKIETTILKIKSVITVIKSTCRYKHLLAFIRNSIELDNSNSIQIVFKIESTVYLIKSTAFKIKSTFYLVKITVGLANSTVSLINSRAQVSTKTTNRTRHS